MIQRQGCSLPGTFRFFSASLLSIFSISKRALLPFMRSNTAFTVSSLNFIDFGWFWGDLYPLPRVLLTSFRPSGPVLGQFPHSSLCPCAPAAQALRSVPDQQRRSLGHLPLRSVAPWPLGAPAVAGHRRAPGHWGVLGGWHRPEPAPGHWVHWNDVWPWVEGIDCDNGQRVVEVMSLEGWQWDCHWAVCQWAACYWAACHWGHLVVVPVGCQRVV